jgi:ribosomal protein S18 acetylase RimI-like enzyme
VSDFGTYLESLLGSWELLAAACPGAEVLRHGHFLASVSPCHPVFNNAILLAPGAVQEVTEMYEGVGNFAIWSHDVATARALDEHGFTRAEVTRPMVCKLNELSSGAQAPVVRVLHDAPVEQIAALNGVSEDLLVGLRGVRAYATEDFTAGAVLMEVGSDVNVSFVATRSEQRRRGLASAVLRVALEQAHLDGFRTSSLQSTQMAQGVYQRLGYAPVGTWQEWTPGKVQRVTAETEAQ